MCARYQMPSQAATERYWRLAEPLWSFQPSWRVLPTHTVPVILNGESGPTGRMMRWGLIPRGGPQRYPLVNCTAEKIDSWYGWKGPWDRSQRCILPFAGFYEPHRFAEGRKAPFYVHLVDRPIFGVAGLWERQEKPGAEDRFSCALITIPPNSLLAEIHNERPRMPAILREADHAAWLTGNPSQALEALRPYPSDLMVAWEVSAKVNSRAAPDDADLIAPVSA
jgi:putative SOS response-associated peptidase YedK